MEPISSLIDPLTEDEDERLEEGSHQSRLSWLTAIFVLLALVLVTRLYYLQIIQGPELRDRADNNRYREVTIPASRGVIYDRNHVALARNRPTYNVGYVPADLKDRGQLETVLRRLSVIVGVPDEKLRQAAAETAPSPFDLVPLVENVKDDLAFAVEERHRDLPGIHVVPLPTRDYINGPLTSPFLGFIGRISRAQYDRLKDDGVHRYRASDNIGQAGLERTFESQLRGEPGEEQMEVDATGRQVSSLRVSSPKPGQNLILTIDQRLQERIGATLQEGIDRYRTASVVVLDPRDGQVLAMVHLPSYDNNLFADGISQEQYQKLIDDPRHPLINGAVSSAYPPGSIFHLVTAAAALETGVVTPKTKIECPGFITVPNRFDPTVGTRLFDWKALGTQDIQSALADSCRVFFYQIGAGDPNGSMSGVGVEGLARFAHLFGLGDLTGLDLAEEVPGLVPTVRWKRQEFNQEWVPMDTYQMAVGEGYLTTTPIQLANALAAVANGGTLYRPQLVLQIIDTDGTVLTNFQPEVIRKLPIKPGHLALIQRGIASATLQGQTAEGTTFDGTARNAAVDGWSVAGLTSSVDFGVPDKDGKTPTHGWFVGYAPVEHPVVAVAVFLENGSGSDDAAKIARQVFEYAKQPAEQ